MKYVVSLSDPTPLATPFTPPYLDNSLVTSTTDGLLAGSKSTSQNGPPLHAISHAVQRSPMLLHFLKETKKQSYFTGHWDNAPVSLSCGGGDFGNVTLA